MENDAIREALWEVEMEWRRMLRPYFLGIGLTLGQGQPRILRALAQEGPKTQRELADVCRMDVATMSRTLDRLEEAGLLCREKNPDSRRSYRVSLTPAGQEKAALVREGFRQVEERLREGFSPEELSRLRRDLLRLRRNLEGAEAEPPKETEDRPEKTSLLRKNP